jgi:hypothetical protein
MVLTKGICVGTLFHLDVCTIECNNYLIFVARSYIGSTTSQLEPSNQVTPSKRKLSTEKTMLWHRILGHIGEKGIRALKKKTC